jgi:glycosyltransferase involved in cell wall biosynthesis
VIASSPSTPFFRCPPRSDGRPRLTVLLTTLDEERHVGACLGSVAGIADGIVVVDSFSTDRTREIAAAAGAEVWQHEFLGSAAQKNWAMARIESDWLLVVDADERIPEGLAREIRETVDRNAAGPAGYSIRRVQWVLGAPIRFSGWGTDSVVRLVRSGRGSYPDRRVHAEMTLDGERGMLRGRMVHHTFESLERYIPKVDRFALWGAAQVFRDGARSGIGRAVTRSGWRFFRTFALQLGFLDGWRGLLVCALQGWGTFLKWARVAEWSEAERSGRPIEGMPRFEKEPGAGGRLPR